MRLSQVGASPGLRRGTFPFGPLWMAQQGQVNRPLHWESHRQLKISWMLMYLSVVNCLVVHPLLVLAGRGKRTRFLSEMEEGIT